MSMAILDTENELVFLPEKKCQNSIDLDKFLEFRLRLF